MTDWTLARIRAYYAEHAAVVGRHLTGRRVQGYPPDHGYLAIASVDDLLTHVGAGVGGFRISPARVGAPSDEQSVDRLIVTLSPGDGTDIATAATAALGLLHAFAGEGREMTAVVDGQGGMQLVTPTDPIDPTTARAFLNRVIFTYADLAPELATLDPERADGRVLISADATDPEVYSWAPYSLVPGAWPGVVVPLHPDDVAAASAGMPLEIEPEDVTDRLELRGDPLDRPPTAE